VIHVPSPTAGIGSLDDGIGRTSGFSGVAWPIAGEGSDAAAPNATIAPSAWRRDVGGRRGGNDVIERAEAIATKQTLHRRRPAMVKRPARSGCRGPVARRGG